MAKLVRFEIRKLLKSKYFYIITLISLVYVLINAVAQKALLSLVGDIVGGGDIENMAYNFTKASFGNTFIMLLGIFVSIMATEDFSQTTVKNVYGKGYNRFGVFLSKYFVSIIATVVLGALTVAVSYLFSTAFWGSATNTKDDIFLIALGQLCGLIAYQSVFFLVAYAIAKGGAAIAINIIAPIILPLVLMLLDLLIKSEDIILENLWIESNFNNLVSSTTDYGIIGRGFAVFIAYIVVSVILGYIVSKRSEV